MDDDEQRRYSTEEAHQRQIDAQERQLDRAFDKKVAMGHAAGGDQQIEQHEQVTEPAGDGDIAGVGDVLACIL